MYLTALLLLSFWLRRTLVLLIIVSAVEEFQSKAQLLNKYNLLKLVACNRPQRATEEVSCTETFSVALKNSVYLCGK